MKMIVTGRRDLWELISSRRSLRRDGTFSTLMLRNPETIINSKYWRRVDDLDRDHIVSAFCTYRPDIVLHVAARTDLYESRNIKGYAANVGGVANVNEAVRRAGSLERTVFASSRMVSEIGYTPKDDADYKPSTLYEESKVQGERLARDHGEDFGSWTIVRPTSI